MGICIQGCMLICEDELRTLNVAMIVAEKLTYMQNLTKSLDHNYMSWS